MIIIRERKKDLSTNEGLARIALLLGQMSVILTQIDMKMAVIKFYESYFYEGSVEDREFVRNKIVELQIILNELDQVRLMLIADDLRTSFSEKETSLKKGQIAVESIRQTMLSIWEMRKSGDTDEDNKKIIELMKKAFTTVNNIIRQIKSYVDSFNVKSYRKLSFNVKWTSLPK